MSGGTVEDQTKGAFFGGVVSEEDDGFVKISIAEGWIGKEKPIF